MKQTITVRTRFRGAHCYPSAPQAVGFLGNSHRHEFHVEVELSVTHDDRELEFLLVQQFIDAVIDDMYPTVYGIKDLGSSSCEAIARKVGNRLKQEYGATRLVRVSVFEDGENGANLTADFLEQFEERSLNDIIHEGVLNDSERFSSAVLDAKVSGLGKYQDAAYNAVQFHQSRRDEISHWLLGLQEEVGELSSIFKHSYCGEAIDKMDVAIELGDVLWYLSAVATSLGIPLETVANLNLAKLHHRHPTGEFDAERSAERKEHDVEFKDTPEYMAAVKEVATASEGSGR